MELPKYVTYVFRKQKYEEVLKSIDPKIIEEAKDFEEVFVALVDPDSE